MPTFVPRTNLPTKEPFRWSLNVARRELGVSSGTLSQRLSDANEAPGEDGCFSSRQLLSAVFGSLHKAKLEQVQQETQHTVLKNQILRGEYLAKDELTRIFGETATSMLEVIQHSKLTLAEQADLQRVLSTVPIRISDLAKAHSRLGEPSPNGHPKRGRKPKRPAEAKSVAPSGG
jgi:hypothetical protein